MNARHAQRGRAGPARESPLATATAWRTRHQLLAVLVSAIAVKATVLAQLGGHPLLQPHGALDTTYYIELGRQVARGGPLAVTEPFFVSPLYVYFLAAAFKVGASLLAIKVVQIVLGTAAVGLLCLVARQWFGERVAWLAAALMLFTGLFSFSEILILQAALDPFLTACTLFFIARTQADARPWPLVAAGVSTALFALNRPNALAYGLIVPALIALASRRCAAGTAPTMSLASPVGRAAVFVAGLLLVLAPNALRNYVVSGEAIVISSHGGLNFYIGNSPGADGVYQRVPGITPTIAGQVRDATRVAQAAEGRTLSTAEVSRHFYRLAWQWIATHPGAALRLFGRKIALVLNATDVPLNYSYAYYSRDEVSLLRALLVGPWLLVPLGLVGLFLPSMRPGRPGFWVWASFVPIYGLSVAAFFVSDRYRMPLLVPLCATAAATLVWLFDRLRARHVAALTVPAIVLSLLIAVTYWNLGVDEGRGGEQTRNAVWLVEQGSYADARRYVAAVSSGHSHPGVLRFKVGEALLAAGRYHDAVDLLREALAIDRDRAAIHLALGQALLAGGRADEAVPHLSTALDAGYRREVSGPWLVRALASLGRREQVVMLVGTLPDDVAALRPQVALDLGAAALEFGAPGAAERWLELAVALAPDNAEAHEQLGVTRLLLKRPYEAAPSLEAASRLDPSSASARLNLAVVYAQLGRFDEARANATEAQRLDPREPRAAELLNALQGRTRR